MPIGPKKSAAETLSLLTGGETNARYRNPQ
jgi:hypothetical protein